MSVFAFLCCKAVLLLESCILTKCQNQHAVINELIIGKEACGELLMRQSHLLPPASHGFHTCHFKELRKTASDNSHVILLIVIYRTCQLKFCTK